MMKSARYFDAHCHLQDQRFENQIDLIIEKSLLKKVGWMCSCGTSESDWDQLISLSSQFSCIIPALAVHPWYIDSISENWLTLLEEKLITHGTIIGECGLDFVIKDVDKEKQLYVFEQQLLLAQKLKKTVCIHCRGAWQSLIQVLDKVGELPGSGLIHSYSGSADMVSELEKRGFYISFSGSVTNLNNKKIEKALRKVSSHRLLTETDSPDITPYDLRGDSGDALNKPYNLPFIIEMIAKRTGNTQNEIMQNSYENAKTLFKSSING
ncbi:MAG: TatD family hydrolase [Deltaproteobacteria bacterium]|jgi:TatD DNase family protein|nr:TatD family hydrolase [Deltaproteobacteria bacterium]